MKPSIFLLGIVAVTTCSVLAQSARETQRLISPDRAIEVSIEMPAGNSPALPRWSAVFKNNTILTNCALSLQTARGELMAGAKLVRTQQRTAHENVPILFGKASVAQNHYYEIDYSLETAQGLPLRVTFRCYSDAVALRYELGAEGSAGSVTITNEATSFHLAGDPLAYIQQLEHYKTSHEHNVSKARYSELRPGALLDLPITFAWPDGTYAAITEAALRNYAGMALRRSATGALICDLTPRPDGSRVARSLPLKTPWRVVLMGENPGKLLESNTIYCLNEPSAIADTSWIKPGKITFSWWNGDVYDGRPGVPILSVEMAGKYIDFCARHGIPFHSLTSTEGTVTPWYQQSKPGVEPGPDTDVTRPRPGFELGEIRRYAESKGVRLWTWVHQAALRGRVDEAFAAFEKLGWSGMMVDFFDHDDQEMVEYTEAILKAAARHRILIHLHGIWKPTGLERTYPHLMNHEGALNLEYLKWSDRCPPEHNLMMAFTRLIAGPMDYHLGGFRAVRRGEFKPRNVAPLVLGTRGHHLSMYVCFDNPTPMLADYPMAYEGQAGFDFLKLVPTWWDETKVVAASAGDLLITARRKGSVWYLGGMAAGKARPIQAPLHFLGTGPHRARIWQDGPAAGANPNDLRVEEVVVTAERKLELKLAEDGGFVAEITPAAK